MVAIALAAIAFSLYVVYLLEIVKLANLRGAADGGRRPRKQGEAQP